MDVVHIPGRLHASFMLKMDCMSYCYWYGIGTFKDESHMGRLGVSRIGVYLSQTCAAWVCTFAGIDILQACITSP